MGEVKGVQPVPTVPPAVSVLVAVHNGELYLQAALRSIMTQTLSNIEIVVIDDASTDTSSEILERLATEDSRIRIFQLPANLGLTAALNHGLQYVQAPLVARMDADDIAHPDRLARQKALMDACPGVRLCGTSIRTIDKAGQLLRRSVRPRDAVMSRWTARLRPSIMHPTFMFRRTLPDGTQVRYDESFPVAQDYALIAQLLGAGEVVSLPDVLLDYRVHGGAISSQKWALQQTMARRVAETVIARDLPTEVVAALGPVLDGYFGQGAVLPRAVLSGFRRMLVHDCHRNPAHAPWFRRQTAQLAFETLKRMRLGSAAIALAFLAHGSALLIPLALRALEIRRMLPHRLRSDNVRFVTTGQLPTAIQYLAPFPRTSAPP